MATIGTEDPPSFRSFPYVGYRNLDHTTVNAINGISAHRVAIRAAALVFGLLLTRTICASMNNLAWKEFELTHEERRELEAVACHPLDLELRAAQASGWETDVRWFLANVRCASHAMIDQHPVFFERFCKYEPGSKYEVGLKCDKEKEMLSVTYSDRRIDINAEGLSLTEAYQVVSYFVKNGLLEPGHVKDSLGGETTLPFDICDVRAVSENRLELACLPQQRRVERIVSGGVVTYREVSR